MDSRFNSNPYGGHGYGNPFGGGGPIQFGYGNPLGLGGGLFNVGPNGQPGVGLGRPGAGNALMQLAMGQEKPGATTTPPHLKPLPVPGVPDRIQEEPMPTGLGGILKGMAGGAMDFLGGNDGMNAILAASTAGDMIGGWLDRREYNRQQRRREEAEDEQRRRYDSWNPERQRLIDEYTSAMGG
jgi:hypothetical protein